MREEWYKFLNQFDYLKASNIHLPLKSSSQSILHYYLEDPEKLINNSPSTQRLKQLVEQTHIDKQQINFRVEQLKEKIVNKFLQDKGFRETIHEIIKATIEEENTRTKAQKRVLSMEELRNSQKDVAIKISNTFESCVIKFDTTLDKETYNKKYNPQTPIDSFLEIREIYKNYLEIIKNIDYFVCTEEILLLDSLANIEITMHYEVNGTNQKLIFLPHQKLIGNYPLHPTLWGTKKKVDIFHHNNHFSHVEECSASVPNQQPKTLHHILLFLA